MNRSIERDHPARVKATSMKLVVLAAFVLCMSPSILLAQEPSPRRASRVLVRDRIVVKPRPETSQQGLRSRISMMGGAIRTSPTDAQVSTEGSLSGLGMMVIKVAPEKQLQALNELAARSDVRMAAPVYRYEPALVPNDPSYANQYHHPLMGSPGAWDKTTGANSVIIAILDTGVNTHPDLPNLMSGWNFNDGNAITTDSQGHGTAVAGCAAAMGNNGVGVAGFAWGSRILPARIADADGSAYSDTIAAAMKWAADQGAKVINCSYGPLQGDSVIESAAAYARSKGALVFVAAGNEGIRESASMSSSIVFVSATDSSDRLTSWSNTGPTVKLAAPGDRILTTTRTGGYSYFSGTSFSSPIAAGAAALIFALDPSFTPSNVEEILRSTAKDLGTTGYDEKFGYGRIDVRAAVVSTAPELATMTAPTPGSTISGTQATFQWTKGNRVSAYWLAVGKTQGGTEYFGAAVGTNLSQSVSGLATDGSTIHVRIWSQIGTVWTGNFQDVTYTATSTAGGGTGDDTTVVSTPAELIAPDPGSTLAGKSATFKWSAGAGVTQYWLAVGSTVGGTEYFGANVGTSLSTNVTTLPTNGSVIHVRLWSAFNGVWGSNYRDYTLQAVKITPYAAITSPDPGAVLSGSTETFIWSKGTGVSQYWLAIGATQGGTEYFGANMGTATSLKISGLPVDGRTLHVRIWSLINGSWGTNFNDAKFTAASSGSTTTIAKISSPTPSSTLPGTTTTFAWSSGTGVSRYWLAVGSTQGGTEYFGADVGTVRSLTVTNLPSNGSTIFVRLWSLINGVWTNNFQDVTYTAVTGSSIATMVSPAAGSILSGRSVTFAWTKGQGVSAYWLAVGRTSGGTEFFGANVGTTTTMTIGSLPSDGSTVYVRIWSQIGTSWTNNYQDTSYRASAASSQPAIALIQSPAAGSTLNSSTLALEWSPGSGATSYWLCVGSTQGGTEYFGANVGLNLGREIQGLPTNGSTVHVRLWTQIGTQWTDNYQDITLTTASQ